MTYSCYQKDLYRHTGEYSKNPITKGFFKPGYRFMYILRKAKNNKGVITLFYKILLRRYSIKYGYQISYKTTIGDGLYLGHWGAVVINPKTIIGDNCNIAQGVTIGQSNRGKNKGVPTIGNNVWIGPNAVIVGNITIGNNVLIAPNSYVNTNIPDNSIVVGNPATIRSNENATEGYINNTI